MVDIITPSIMLFTIIAAFTADDRGIGFNNTIPWHIPEDMRLFKDLTTHVTNKEKKNVLIMGKNTYLSIPKKNRPLVDRYTIIISSMGLTLIESEPEIASLIEKTVFIDKSLTDALHRIRRDMNDKIENVFVIGGQQLYEEAITMDCCAGLIITEIYEPSHVCDRFFPTIDSSIYKRDKGINLTNKNVVARADMYVKNQHKTFLEGHFWNLIASHQMRLR